MELRPEDLKSCTKLSCVQKNPQTLNNFYKNHRQADGYCGICKHCQIISAKKWNKNNQDKRRKIKAKYWREKGNLDRKPWLVHKKDYCEDCGFVALDSCQLDVDHIDGNRFNDNQNNLQTLCANCHRLKTKLNNDYKKYKGMPKMGGAKKYAD